MQVNKDYSHFSLESLKTWINDAMESGAEPEEVYEAISSEIDLQIKYHTQKLHYANKLKTMLQHGATRPHLPTMDDFKAEGYEYTPLIPKKT